MRLQEPENCRCLLHFRLRRVTKKTVMALKRNPFRKSRTNNSARVKTVLFYGAKACYIFCLLSFLSIFRIEKLLSALKAEMKQKSSDEIQSLKDKVRYLQEENDKLKCKLKFYEVIPWQCALFYRTTCIYPITHYCFLIITNWLFSEFTNVRTWIDQLIAKQQLSSPSDVIATVSKIDEPPSV